MKRWYETREECSLQHRNQVVKGKKKVWLTQSEADLHNLIGKQLTISSDPDNADCVGIVADWLDWVAYQAPQQEDEATPSHGVARYVREDRDTFLQAQAKGRDEEQ